MPDALSEPFAEAIAERMRAAHERLAARWLVELRELLVVPTEHLFPSTSLLDHIPSLIAEIASAIASGADEAIVARTVVVRKAQELGELRFDQKATVHQLLREYRLLGEVLNDFVAEEVAAGDMPMAPAEVLAVSARLHQAVFVLMQTTVDTFVSRYAGTIEQQTRRLEGFNRTLSHELRQPLGAIRSAVELLAMADPGTSTSQRRCVEIITVNTRRMATLTSTLLMLSSLDSKSIEVQEIDLARLISDVAEQLAEMAGSRQVDVRLSVPSTRIRADVARLELVAVNLLSNAIKYSDPRKPHRFVDVRVVHDADRIRLSVADNGLGISDEERGRVFEEFYRAQGASDREVGADGVGLGLAIVAECIKHLGASVEVESAVGDGTTFHVSFPADAPAAATPGTRGGDV